MKMNIKNENIIIILILIIGFLIITCFNRNKKEEGFGDLENHTQELELELKKNLTDMSKEDLFKIITNLKQNNPSEFMTLEQHGKFSEMTEHQARKLLQKELKNHNDTRITLETQINSLTNDITRKNKRLDKIEKDIQELIKNPNVDYNKFVLKESIPPIRQCPSCICPKVSVSAGLCKKCPPPPECPPPNRCPEVKCPDPKPCKNKLQCPPPNACPPPPTCPVPKPCQKPKTLYKEKIKYIKIPTFISRNNNLSSHNKIVNRKNVPKISKHIPKAKVDKCSLTNDNDNDNYTQYENSVSNNNNEHHINYNIRELNSEYIKASEPINGFY